MIADGLMVAGAGAGNIDPFGREAQYAWSENLGWLNAQPLGRSGPGLQVDDFEVTGWMWGENIGWVSASCKNTSSCDRVEYGVRNDRDGILSGEAWGENLGWIRFRPLFGGVRIDPATGEWSGTAWAENGGWINFEFLVSGTNRIQTGWTCNGEGPPPSGVPELTVSSTVPSGGSVLLSWGPAASATGHDIIRGDLARLRATGGDFRQATTGCLRDNYTMTDLVDAGTLSPGEGIWYLVRDINCTADGPYDTAGAGQAAPRDAGIDASSNSCP